MIQSHRVVLTDYLRYRARLRAYDLAEVENIVRFSNERYYDTSTGRSVAVGRADGRLVMIPYEIDDDVIKPVTIHATTRQQINSRIRSERFSHE